MHLGVHCKALQMFVIGFSHKPKEMAETYLKVFWLPPYHPRILVGSWDIISLAGKLDIVGVAGTNM